MGVGIKEEGKTVDRAGVVEHSAEPRSTETKHGFQKPGAARARVQGAHSTFHDMAGRDERPDSALGTS